ncbi:Bug family tripartite tricarboxylate transporter substrate binding protein [Bradyrhizobium sp.]|uniref:Bug family tripartite tricarboxylate transporter substrate binding protein n=1 Tax=Bradyrhizobium sp. TaxID=376 RepID=UPI003C72721F
MLSRRELVCAAGSIVLLAVRNSAARAQGTADWPIRPVRLIVNLPGGSSTDRATRIFADHLSRRLGQPFVIINQGGASGVLGVEAAIKSPPDGYTFLATPAFSIVIAPHLLRVSFDPFKDLVPVTQFVDATLVLAVHPSVPADSAQELVTFAARNPGKLKWGTPGVGSTAHLLCEALKLRAGIDILCVPYRGGNQTLPDFLAGVVQIHADPNTLPYVPAGKAKLLAVLDRHRHPDFPNVPLLQEIYPELDFLAWLAVFAPNGTPDPIVRRMSKEMNIIAGDAEVRRILLSSGLAPHPGTTPEELSVLLRKDYERYGKLVRQLNLNPQ